ncbi:MAG: T9SS type A sorting domain-containing protein [Bacteroidales bacterium]|nr:T9SS type A sorting domain-containing protein [Bacteroidales bacterium]
MKKTLTLIIVMTAFITVSAQWVNDPASNTFLANTSADAGEIYISTDPVSGDTYMQWCQFASNGWVPKVQRLNAAGEPQWDASGLQPAAQHTLASWSQGVAMAATTDNAVVSCFSTEAGNSVAVKINADGTFAWGDAGITLFNGAGGSRTELLAGDDGGVWALATDNTNSYLCYINADGTTNPTITISDDTQICTFGQLVPTNDGNVFLVYEKEQWAYTYFYEKDIRVVGYNKNGTQISEDIQLMSPVTIPGAYIHYVVPDGLGGGYVYIWHAGGIGGTFNTYVFHFNHNGASTINDLNGIPVHSADPDYFYISASATVDPDSHDLILFYEQTDEYSQTQCKLYMNRITSYGERVWDEGILVLDNGTTPCGGLNIDAFEYGGGFAVTYFKGLGTGSQATVEAQGFDMNGNSLWNTQMSSTTYNKTGCDNTSGFHGGQNIISWVNSNSGGLYGQNIGQLGEMGEVTPPTPPAPCDAPTNLQGEYYYEGPGNWGVNMSWTAPQETPLHYNLYVTDPSGCNTTYEIPSNYNSCIMPTSIIGDVIIQLTAVYDDCESDYALTPDGENYLLIELTSIPENEYEEIVNVIEIYNINGQLTNTLNINDLNQGIYIIKGVTQSGKTAIRKIVK